MSSDRLNRFKNPGAKRLMLEAQELRESTEDYCAQPVDDNLFEWHFTIRGPPDTAFEGGIYHGRLTFPTEYPMKPPWIILLTPSGRFKTNMKICLSISGYHPETWRPSWSIRTALLALIAFLPTKSAGAMGSLDNTDEQRRVLARKSQSWVCPDCGLIKNLLKEPAVKCSSSSDTCGQPSTSTADRESSQQEQPEASDRSDAGQEEPLKESSVNSETDSNMGEDVDLANNPQTTAVSSDAESDEQPVVDTIVVADAIAHAPSMQEQTESVSSRYSFMFKSIIILLLVLVLRRFVIIMQS